MKIIIVLAVAFCVALLAANLPAENEQRTATKAPNIEDILLGKDSEARKSLANSLREQRQRAMASLIAVLKQDSGDGKSNLFLGEAGPSAAALLGELHAVEAVTSLTDRIAMRPLVVDVPAMETVFPCFWALVQIGKPASLESIERLASEKFTESDNGKLGRSELLLKVVCTVEGDDVARFMLQNAIDKEQDKDKKANLTAALELLDKWIKADAERNKPPENPAPPSDSGTTPAP